MKKLLTLAVFILFLTVLFSKQSPGAGPNPISDGILTTDLNGNTKNIFTVKINGLDFVNTGGTSGPFTFTGTGTVLLTNGSASNLIVNATGFNGNLTPSDDTIQEIAQKLDDLTVVGGGSFDLVNDLTPQLGGDLDLNGHNITGMIIGTNLQAWTLNLENWSAVGTGIDFRTWAGAPTSSNLYNTLTTKSGTGLVSFIEGTLNITAGQTLNVTTGGTIGSMAYQANTGASIDIQKANGTGGLTPVNPDEVFTFTEPGYSFIPYHNPSPGGWFTGQFDTDQTLAANAANRIPSQQAVKSYADGKVSPLAYNAGTWDGVTDKAANLDAVRDKIEALTIGAGSGTVTNFTAGTLSPLFTTSVSDPTGAPNLDFILTAAAAKTFFGNNTTGSAAPIFMTGPQALTTLGLAATDAPTWANIRMGVSNLTWAATLPVDFTGDRFQQVTMTGNTTVTASNMLSGRTKVIQFTASGSTWTLAWPGTWNWVGTTAPASLAASKKAMLVLTSYGSTEATVSAQWFLQDQAAGGGSGITDIVQDLTPQLGGDLDLNGHVITGAPTLAGSNTWTGANLFQGVTVSLTNPISAASWTTAGIKLKQPGVALTDTTIATGTTGAAYTNVMGGDTISATNTGVVFTNYYELFVTAPAPGTNVTITNPWALGADSLRVLGATTISGTFTAGASTVLSGVISPTAITGSVNNYSPTGLNATTVVRQDVSGGNWDITGLQGGITGRILNIVNISTTSNNLTLKDQSGSSSSANQFLFGADLVLAPNDSALLRYDGTSNKWRRMDQLTQTATSAASLSISGQTGLLSVQGLTSTNRVKTVRDAADTVLELGGTYTADGLTAGSVTRNHAIYAAASPPTVDVGIFTIVKTGIDLKAAGTTAVFTVPTSRTFVLTGAAALVTSVTTPGAGTVQFQIKESGANGAMSGNQTSTSATPAVGNYFTEQITPTTAPYVACVAGNNVNLVMSVSNAGSTAVAASIFLTGFYAQ